MSLQVTDLVAGYGKVEIVHGVNLTAKASSVTGIIGPNGSGKSTILKTIAGYIKPWRGEVLYEGQDIGGRKPHTLLKSGLAYLMQRRSAFADLTVEQNLKLGEWIMPRERTKLKSAIEDMYNLFPKLRERRNTRAGSLSGGEQRMVELARALITRPKVLLIDEFSTGLSPKVYTELYDKLQTISKDEHITILAVDQNVVEIAEVADYIYVIKLGNVDTEGPIDDFRSRLDAVVQSWLKA